MKKITFLALACAMFMGNVAANAQDVTYVEDPAQGYIFNKMADNWFISAAGGAGMMMSKYDSEAEFKDRVGAKAQLSLGKWFSPLLGVRIGGEFNQMRGATPTKNTTALGYRPWKTVKSGYVKQKFNNIGGFLDVMFNATNWICGYKPGRFYNAVIYAGGGIHWVYEHDRTTNAAGLPTGSSWKYAGGNGPSRNYSARAGWLSSFRINNRFDVNLDLRFEMMQEHVDGWTGVRTWSGYPSVLAGFTYKFGKTEWNAPVVPVCPPVVDNSADLDALRAKLEAANAKIKSLEDALKKCREKKPVQTEAPKAQEAEAPLATIYYPINVSKIVGVQNDVVDAVSEVMKNENNNYVLTGWADNYTGNDQINTRLRKERVAGVKSALISKGIEESRLDAQINDGNLTNYGAKCASLDRAVTIFRAK